MITALMPVRNGASTIETALESLHAQSVRPTQCIVVDDGSTDSTPRLLSEWQARWEAITILRTPGVGIAGALNLGLAAATQPWIARLDADDRSRETRLERQLETASHSPDAALVSCEASHWTTDVQASAQSEGMRRHIDWANSLHGHEELERALWIDSPLPHPTWLVHRRAFETVGVYNETEIVPEDYEWLHRFFAQARTDPRLRARKVAGTPLVDWRDGPARLTRTNAAYREEAFNVIKARSLRRLLAGRTRELFIFGLGPKCKALLPVLAREAPALRIAAIVEVNPRQIGTRYQGIEVCDVASWEKRASPASFTLIALGTPETRSRGEELCRSKGLIPLESFVAF